MTAGQLAHTPAAGARRAVASETIAGIGGLTFLVLVIFQNLLRAVTEPANNATPAQLLRFAHGRAWTVDLMVVTFVIGFPALLLYASGLAHHLARQNPEATIWAQMGQASVIVIAVFFGLVNLLDVVLVAARADLATTPTLVSLVWSLHNAVFTMDLLAVGGGLLGLGWASAIGGLISRRFGIVCVVGAILLAVAAAPMVSEVHGSPVLGVGLVGFLCWLLFMAVTSTRLLRISSHLRETRAASESVPTTNRSETSLSRDEALLAEQPDPAIAAPRRRS